MGKDGVVLPPMPLKTNDKWNGLALPDTAEAGLKMNPPVSRHNAGHGHYNLAQARHYDLMADEVLKLYDETGNLLLAVAKRDELIAKHTAKVRQALEGTGPQNVGKKMLPLYAKGSSYQGFGQLLEDHWFEAMKTGIRP